MDPALTSLQAPDSGLTEAEASPSDRETALMAEPHPLCRARRSGLEG